jgi:hypothetical protein
MAGPSKDARMDDMASESDLHLVSIINNEKVIALEIHNTIIIIIIIIFV